MHAFIAGVEQRFVTDSDNGRRECVTKILHDYALTLYRSIGWQIAKGDIFA